MTAHLKGHGPVNSLYPLSFLVLPGRFSAAAPVQRCGSDVTHTFTKDLSAEIAPVIHRDVHARTLAGWRFLLSIVVLAGLIGAPEARAQHICDLAGYECRPAEAGPWSIQVVTSNLIPVTAERFSTEGDAIAAGSAGVCLPQGDTRLGALVCSCSVTSIPEITTLVWSFGMEKLRGSGGNWGIATYQMDYSLTPNCNTPRPWEMPWEVQAIRTIECPAGYYPDDHNPPEACWRQDPCPVARLTPIPTNDTCAQTLEAYNSTPAQKTAACGTLTTGMQTAVNCFAGKLSQINNPETGQPIPLRITADIRNLAYQAHFREIWDKMELLVEQARGNPALQTACAARRTELAAEKGCDNAGPCAPCSAPTATARRHCLASTPAPPNPNDATHVQGNAIDVDRGQTIDPLAAALSQRTPPQSIQGLLDAPTNCRLDYLGVRDPVHFQLRP